MTNYKAGDIVLVVFPFAGGEQSKSRPAMVVLDGGDADIVVARITTQLHQTLYDTPIADWRGGGLLAPSMVRLHKLATLEKALVRRKLGSLQPKDLPIVATMMQRIYGDW